MLAKQNKFIKYMKKFIKENWFKLMIVICIVITIISWVMLDRFYYMNMDGKYIIMCKKITGSCGIIKAERWY
jgi:hypothetical protein